jgi:outer membrane protein assembly factor BamB
MNRRILLAVLAVIIIVVVVYASIDFFWLEPERVPDDKRTVPINTPLLGNLWPQYRSTITHDGRAHYNSSLSGTINKTWTTIDINVEYYGASKSSPAVDTDLVFIGSDTGKLYAFWRSNGTEFWSYSTRPSQNGIHSSPAFDSEKVYFGAYDGWLYAVYKYNHTRAWETKLGDYIGSSPCLYNGVAYIGVEMSKPSGYLVGCNMTTGVEVFRSKPFGSHPHSTPSVDPNRGYIYIGANDNRIYCYNLTTQNKVWSYRTGGPIKSTPAVTEDILYVTSWDYKLHAFDSAKGERYFSYKTGKRTMSSPTISADGKRVYFGSHDGYIHCVAARDGGLIWKFKTGEIILSSPTLIERDNTIVCGSNSRYVYILNATNGKVVTELSIKSAVTSVPVVVGSELYIFDNEGRLHRFDAE